MCELLHCLFTFVNYRRGSLILPTAEIHAYLPGAYLQAACISWG